MVVVYDTGPSRVLSPKRVRFGLFLYGVGFGRHLVVTLTGHADRSRGLNDGDAKLWPLERLPGG